MRLGVEVKVLCGVVGCTEGFMGAAVVSGPLYPHPYATLTVERVAFIGKGAGVLQDGWSMFGDHFFCPNHHKEAEALLAQWWPALDPKGNPFRGQPVRHG